MVLISTIEAKKKTNEMTKSDLYSTYFSDICSYKCDKYHSPMRI